MTDEERRELIMQKKRECSKLCSLLSNPFTGYAADWMSEEEYLTTKKRARELDEEVYCLSKSYEMYLRLLKEREQED